MFNAIVHIAYVIEIISHKLTIFGTNLHLKYDTDTGKKIKEMLRLVRQTNEILSTADVVASDKRPPTQRKPVTLKDMVKGVDDES